jgi:hypothetical protein
MRDNNEVAFDESPKRRSSGEHLSKSMGREKMGTIDQLADKVFFVDLDR